MNTRLAGFAIASIVPIAFIVSGGFAPNDACVGQERTVSTALTQYLQDYDERFPNMSTAANFMSAIGPYGASAVCPDTHKPYAPNPALSYTNFASLDLDNAVAFQDAAEHPDGSIRVGFVNGQIKQDGDVQGDPDPICVQKVAQLSLGLMQYAQDYDEALPLMSSQSRFQSALWPYVPVTDDFVCPVTQRQYQPNVAISGMRVTSIPGDSDNIQTCSDPVPHPEGYATVGYLDGHAANGPVSLPEASCVRNIKSIVGAVCMYGWDYGTVPPTTSYSAFEQALLPFTHTLSVFTCPDTGLPYLLNTSISGAKLTSSTDWSQVPIVADATINNDGTANTGYVDGHWSVKASYIPRRLALDSNGAIYLLWSRAARTPSGEQAYCSGLITHMQSAVLRPTITLALGPYAGTPSLVAAGSNDQIGVLWVEGAQGANTFASCAAGALQSTTVLGLYDGWTPVAATAHLRQTTTVWRRYDGTIAVWANANNGQYISSVEFNEPRDWSVVDAAYSSDGSVHVLIRDAQNNAQILSVGASHRSSSYRGSPGQVAEGFAYDASDHVRILWGSANGSAEIWTPAAFGHQIVTLPAEPGATASELAIGPDNNLRILWRLPNDSVRIELRTANGSLLQRTDFAPFGQIDIK